LTDTRLSQAEAELALERLLDHHQKWLMTQPELLLLWPLGRAMRRRVAELLAKELLTIPTRDINESTPPNRAMRRAILAELAQRNPTWWEGDERPPTSYTLEGGTT
jgi:hypothetical protein